MNESSPNRRRHLPLGIWQILTIGVVVAAQLPGAIAFLGQISQLVSIARTGFSGAPKGDS